MTEHSQSYPGSSGQRDIVARLRWPDGLSGPEDHPVSVALRIEAADEIERLRGVAQAPAYPECDTLRQALDAIEAQVHEMRSLKGWRLNLIRENLAKAKACIHGVAQAPLTRRSEADAYFTILQTIARFPITDPKNMDAVNMRLIAEGALALSPTTLATLPGHDETMANLDALTISSKPRCTCAAIVNPNIPHARSCPLSTPHGDGK